jgi:N-acetylglucosaminyldiphosphoundecaprenol N-acetyl-beta-D-mannosaminyltransferase
MTSIANRAETDRVHLLGVPVDIVDYDAAMRILQTFLESDRPNWVATADASGIEIAQHDQEFFDLLQTADLVTPDSIGVIWACKRAGIELPGRVSGVELVDRLCALSAQKGYRIYFLGAAPGVAEMAAEKMRLRHPGCNIVGTRHGFFPASDDEVVASEVAELEPDILFVAMGIPRQEKFICKTQGIIQAKVAMGVGGSLDVFSGRVKRAPVFIQKLHLEWLWRTLANPKKLSKAKHLPLFVLRVLKNKR